MVGLAQECAASYVCTTVPPCTSNLCMPAELVEQAELLGGPDVVVAAWQRLAYPHITLTVAPGARAADSMHLPARLAAAPAASTSAAGTGAAAAAAPASVAAAVGAGVGTVPTAAAAAVVTVAEAGAALVVAGAARTIMTAVDGPASDAGASGGACGTSADVYRLQLQEPVVVTGQLLAFT